MGRETGEVGKTLVEHKVYEETHFEWRIPNFFPVSEGLHCYDSPCFSAGDISASQYFRLFPNSTDYPGFMSFYFASKDKQECTMEFKVGLKKSDGSVQNFVPGIFQKDNCFSSPCKLSPPLVLQSPRSELVPSNVLSIICILKREITEPTTLQTTLSKSKSLRFISLDKLSENFRDLFDDKETCDTTLKVKDKDYKAHRTVLMARSSVFAATFKHDSSEKQTGIITIPDCDPDSFPDFLQYLYCGRLEDLSFQNALSLYVTSDKYDVQELKEFCVQYLIQCLTVENVCDVAALADKYEETQLFSAVKDFFKKNGLSIFLTSQWEHLMKKDYRLAHKLLTEFSSAKLKE